MSETTTHSTKNTEFQKPLLDQEDMLTIKYHETQ